jgi:Protein of unknown function (DUF2846)
MKKLLALIIVFGLFGCAASGPKFTEIVIPNGNNAVVYFYRPSLFFQGGGSPSVFVNEKQTLNMLNGGYFYMSLPSGSYTVSPRKNFNWALDVADKVLDVEAGKTYYLKFIMSDTDLSYTVIGQYGGGTISGKSQFVLVSKEVATEELKQTKQVK